jgi:putative flavoprotein involved in K+ transport
MSEAAQGMGIGKWLVSFASAVSEQDISTVESLFAPTCLWRDVLSFGWTIATHEGQSGVKAFVSNVGQVAVTDLQIESGEQDAEGFFQFSIPAGRVRGHVRLAGEQCVTLLTVLDKIAGHPEAIHGHRPLGLTDSNDGRLWRDKLDHERASIGVTEQPYVLIVGAGQGGLALGARLRALGVPTVALSLQVAHPA